VPGFGTGRKMNAFDEQSRSLWMDTVVAVAPALSENKRVDTVVVG